MPLPGVQGNVLGRKDDVRLLVAGLDAAGKTSTPCRSQRVARTLRPSCDHAFRFSPCTHFNSRVLSSSSDNVGRGWSQAL
eukprot:6197613-Pleurochrysis_carterae.AAC.1